MVDGDAELKSGLSKSAKRRLRQRRAIERVQAPIDRSQFLLMRAADVSKSPCQSLESRLNALEFMLKDIHWCLIGQHLVVNLASTAMEPTVEMQRPLFDPDAPEFWPTEVDSGIILPEVGLTVEDAKSIPKSDLLEVEKPVDDRSADASKKVAEPTESLHTDSISADDRAKKQLFQLCTRPDGTLDPCKALELVMGRPKPSGHQRDLKPVEVAKPAKTSATVEHSVLPAEPCCAARPQPTPRIEESKEQRQRSNEEAFLECWRVLGQDRNDADRIKAMLKSVWAWRHSAPATSSAQQWWQILFRRFKNEADCDKAVSDALEHFG